MKLFDFKCMNKDCEKHDQRFSRGFPTVAMKNRYMPVCDACKKECTEVDPIKREYKPAGIAIQGNCGTPTSENRGFAKGLNSNNPEDLKRDLEKGDLFM